MHQVQQEFHGQEEAVQWTRQSWVPIPHRQQGVQLYERGRRARKEIYLCVLKHINNVEDKLSNRAGRNLATRVHSLG
jgi:hypothetical protein